MNQLTRERTLLNPSQLMAIFSQLGAIVRDYHLAGLIHRYVHLGNIGLRMDSLGRPTVILRDLDTTLSLPNGSLEQGAAVRLLDLERGIRALGVGGNKEYLQAFLQGYWPSKTSAEIALIAAPLGPKLSFALLFDEVRQGETAELRFDRAHPIVGPLWAALTEENMGPDSPGIATALLLGLASPAGALLAVPTTRIVAHASAQSPATPLQESQPKDTIYHRVLEKIEAHLLRRSA